MVQFLQSHQSPVEGASPYSDPVLQTVSTPLRQPSLTEGDLVDY